MLKCDTGCAETTLLGGNGKKERFSKNATTGMGLAYTKLRHIYLLYDFKNDTYRDVSAEKESHS